MDDGDADRPPELTRPPLRTRTGFGSWLDEQAGRIRHGPAATAVAVLLAVAAVAFVGWSVLSGRMTTGSPGSPLPKVADVDLPPGSTGPPTAATAADGVDRPGPAPASADGGPSRSEMAPDGVAPDGAVPAAGGELVDVPPAELYVHVAGAVSAPGLYELVPGARVADAVTAAGGFAADADGDRINLAAELDDGQQVYVPRQGEPDRPALAGSGQGPGAGAGGAGTGGPVATPDGPVDVNSASVEQLEALPGIGPSIAAAIVRHREEHGPFRTVDDLADVAGIGPAKLEAIRELVTV